MNTLQPSRQFPFSILIMVISTSNHFQRGMLYAVSMLSTGGIAHLSSFCPQTALTLDAAVLGRIMDGRNTDGKLRPRAENLLQIS